MISTLTEYLTEIKALRLPDSDMSSTTLPWFRGQGNSTWHLLPSMYRGSWKYERERELTRDFQLRALLEVEHKPSTYLGWLFVMQHHGLPTRLLDWTESPIVALYFAVENYDDKSNAAVWIMHPWNLNESKESHGQSSVPQLSKKIDDQYWYPIHTLPDPKLGPPRVAKDLPMALRPVHTTRRIVAQRGQFTIHGREKIGLDQIPSARANVKLKKIEINGQKKLDLLRELYMAGTSRYSLFPDLDGLAQEIGTRYSKIFMG